MKLAEDIQKILGLGDRQMSIKMKMIDNTAWRTFRNSQGKSLKHLYQLYLLSGDSPKEFLERVRKEVEENGK